MGSNIVVGPLPRPLPRELMVEAAERKGPGHPDTLCDYITEGISRALSEYYVSEFGCVMHHNVDKALLVGGSAEPAFGGGRVVKPIEVIIAGRAIKNRGGKALPVDEISAEAARGVLANTVRHLDPVRDVSINVMIRPGSRDLIDLFERFGKGEVPLSNDTSFGVGFYPLDRLERTVYEAERFLNATETRKDYPFIGEDVKIMGIRRGEGISLTAAIAMVDRYVSSVADYALKLGEVKQALLAEDWAGGVELAVNTADDYERGSVYITVTGTSAEQGDDGQVGRGNRVNGLITPYRPMTLEAAAGKNPVSHVGKLYNLFAGDLCREIVESGLAEEASAFLVSRIGKPVNEPQVLDIKVSPGDADFKSIGNTASAMLADMPGMWKRIIAGQYGIA
ncbi:MAG: methionine adenosyltransferase [Thermodesulfobacteriota bacterium]